MPQGETMSIMFVDGAEAPSTNIMDMVSPYAPGFALWNVDVSCSAIHKYYGHGFDIRAWFCTVE